MKLYIKNMVSQRCKLKVKDELDKIGIQYTALNLGVVDILEELTPENHKLLNENLIKSGLELLDDKKIILVERIKN